MSWYGSSSMGSTWDSWLPVSCNEGTFTSWSFAKAIGNGSGHHHPVSVLESTGTEACNKSIVPCREHGAAKTVWRFCFWAIAKTLPAKLQGYHRRRRWRLASGWSCHLESRLTFTWLCCSAPSLCFWVICHSLHAVTPGLAGLPCAVITPLVPWVAVFGAAVLMCWLGVWYCCRDWVLLKCLISLDRYWIAFWVAGLS